MKSKDVNFAEIGEDLSKKIKYGEYASWAKRDGHPCLTPYCPV